LVSVNVCPCVGVPVIVGADRFTGTGGVVTRAVGADAAAVPGPPMLVAVSWTSMVEPTSAASRV
jgi:hypothetical protein